MSNLTNPPNKPTPPDDKNGKAGCLGLITGGIISLIFLFSDSMQDTIGDFFYFKLNIRDGTLGFVAFLLIIAPPIIVPFIFRFINNLLNKTIYKTSNESQWKEYRSKMKVYGKELNEYNKEKVLQRENERIKIEQYRNENRIPSNTMIVNCKKSSFNKKINNNQLFIWIEKDKLCFAGKQYYMGIKRIEIPKDNITSFLRQGDVYNELKISGGKVEGGGSSIGGAIVGGVIAGGAGAVIGSRKEVKGEEIKSENIRIDKRQTILEFIVNDKYEHLFFDSDAYDILIKLIPEKEVQLVNNRNASKPKNVNDNKNVNLNKTITEQIRELAKLKDDGILSEEEFIEIKKKLLKQM